MQGTKITDLKFIVGGLEGEDMFRRTDDLDRVSTRQSEDPSSLAARYARTDMRKYSFGVRVTDSWNRLEPEIRNSRTTKQFKTCLKEKMARN